jgi:predicted permease
MLKESASPASRADVNLAMQGGIDPSALLATSGGAVATVLIIMAGGASLSLRGFLSPDTVKAMNRANMQLMLPCMLFSHVSESASLEAWTVCWVLPFSAALNIGLGFAISTAVALVARLPPARARVLRMSCTFGNAQAFPLVVLTLIAEDFLTADPDAERRAIAYVAYYLVCWSVVCWSFGWWFISAPIAPAGQHGSPEALEGPSRHRRGGFELQPTCETEAAHALSAVESAAPAPSPSDEPCERAPTRDASTNQLLHTPHGQSRCRRAARSCAATLHGILSSQALSTPVVAVLSGLLVGISPLKGLFVGGEAPLHLVHRAMLLVGDSVVPLSTMLTGASLVATSGEKKAQPAAKEEGADGAAAPSAARRCLSSACRADYVGVVCVRMLLLPLLNWLIFLGARRYLGLFPKPSEMSAADSHDRGLNDPLIGFVILLQGAMPTANNVVRGAPRARVGEWRLAHERARGSSSSRALLRPPPCAPAPVALPLPPAWAQVMMVTIAHDAKLSQLAARLMAAQFVLLPLTLVGWIALFLATVYG